MKSFRLILINILFFIIFISSIDIILGGVRYFVFKKPFIGLVIKNEHEVLDDPCKRMMTHPFYGTIHDHNKECNILGGKADGPFVYYESKNEQNYKSIVVLGGSTTDGFFQHYANGETWPYLLQKIIEKNNLNYRIINAANGGHSSKQETLKLLNDVMNLNEKIDYVISFNGINDLPGYDNTNAFTRSYFPFFGGTLVYILENQKWIVQNKYVKILPNIVSLARYLTNACDSCVFLNFKKLNINNENLIISKNKELDASEIWEKNVQLMNLISNHMGAKFYVFIQPSIGLAKYDQYLVENSEDYFITKNTTKTYKKKITDFYQNILEKCSKLDFCIDATDSIIPTDNFYADARHPNEKGNKLIADFIFSKINLNNQ